MSHALPEGFELEDEPQGLPPGFELESELPPGFSLEAEPPKPNVLSTGVAKTGDYLDTGLKTLMLPFEPVGEAIRLARTGEPLRIATSQDPRGIRAPSLIQKFAPSLQTPQPPADPIAETYGGLRGITRAATNLPQGPAAALEAGRQEIERPRNAYDMAAEIAFGLMSGRVGNAPMDAVLEAGNRLRRPILRQPASVPPGVSQAPEIAREAPLALPAPVEGPGFIMTDSPNLAAYAESEVFNPATGAMEIVRRPVPPGLKPPAPRPPVSDIPEVPRGTPEPAPPPPRVPEMSPNQLEPFETDLPEGFLIEDVPPRPIPKGIQEMAARDRQTAQELIDQNRFRSAAQGKLPEGFQIHEAEPKAPAPILNKPQPFTGSPAYGTWESQLPSPERDVINGFRKRLSETQASKAQHVDPETGKYSIPRQAVHEKVLNDARYNRPESIPTAGEAPVARFVIGAPASGKTTGMKALIGEDTLNRSTVIDNDDIKAMLPGYDPKVAGAFHEEATDIEQRVIAQALSRGENVTLSMVGRSRDKLKKYIEALKEGGYKTELYLMDTTPEEAALRAVKRAQKEGGRFVDPAYVIDDVGLKPRETYDSLKAEVDGYARVKTDVPKGAPAEVLETSIPSKGFSERRVPGDSPTPGNPSGARDAAGVTEPETSLVPKGEPAPKLEAATELPTQVAKPIAEKPLSELLQELGDDLAAPLKNEKGAIGNLGEVDEARNARVKENFDELVKRAKAQGYKTSEEIAAFAANNGMKGSQIQALLREFRNTGAAQAAATQTAEKPPKPVLGGGKQPPPRTPEFTVIPPSGGGDPFEKFAGNINLQNLSLDEAAKQIIRDTAKREGPILDKARRGTISLEQTEQMAKELGLTEEEVLKMKKGSTLNAEELTAARNLLTTATKDVQDIAKKIGKGGDASIDLIRLNQAIQKQASIQRVISGVTAEAGRALSSMRILAKPENLADRNMKAILDTLGGRQANVDIAKKLASIDPSDTAAVNAFIREVSEPSIWDKVHEVWINAILSNPITHKVNLTSNLAFAMTRPAEKALAGLTDAAIGLFTGKRGVYASEAIPEAMGVFRGLGEGVRRMLYVLKNGETIESLSKLERGGQEAIKGMKGRIIRLPGTALVAEDEFAKGVNSVMSRASLATRQALSEGLSGKKLVDRIAELEARPTTEMVEAMENEGLYYTFQTPFGPYGQKINGLRRIPGVRYIFPFLRTPLNIAKAGFERSPFGMAGLIPGAVRGEVTQAQVSQALARSAIGSSIAGALAYWTMRGNVTGRPPKEAGKRDAWYAEGKIPYAIKIGDKWRSYQLEPFGAPVGALVDTLQEHIEKKKDISYPLAAYYGLNYAKSMLQRGFLQGISNMFDALSDPERYADKQIAGFGSSAVPFSGTLRFITQSIDPVQRQAETFTDGLMATIPGLSKKVPAKLDVFGEPIERPQRAYQRLLSVQPGGESAVKNDPVRRMVADVDFKLNFPDKQMNKRQMSDAEYNELLSVSGAEIRQNFEMLAKNDAYKNYDAKQVRDIMNRYVKDARERARQMVEPKVEMRHLNIKADLTPEQIEDLGLFMSFPAYRKLETDEEKKDEIMTFIGQTADVGR